MSKEITVGVFIPEFKWERMNLHSVCPEKHGVKLVELDLNKDFDNVEEVLSHYDAILHKFTYQFSDVKNTDPKHIAELEKIERIQKYSQAHPEFKVIEPIDNIKIFTERSTLQKFIEEHPLPKVVEYVKGYLVDKDFTPEKYGLSYPLLLKPESACGLSESHAIQVVNNKEQLDARNPDVEVLAFPFVPHHGVVWKCYTLDETAITRPAQSLKINSTEKVTFDSQKPLPSQIAADKPNDKSEDVLKLAPTQAELSEISNALKTITGVSLIGYDLLRRECDGQLCLVDFNYFPCFRGIEDVPGKFAEFIKQKVNKN